MRAGFLGGRDLELGLVAQQEHSGVQYGIPCAGAGGNSPPPLRAQSSEHQDSSRRSARDCTRGLTPKGPLKSEKEGLPLNSRKAGAMGVVTTTGASTTKQKMEKERERKDL